MFYCSNPAPFRNPFFFPPVPFPAPFAKPCFQHASNFLVYLSFKNFSISSCQTPPRRRYNNRRFKIKTAEKIGIRLKRHKCIAWLTNNTCVFLRPFFKNAKKRREQSMPKTNFKTLYLPSWCPFWWSMPWSATTFPWTSAEWQIRSFWWRFTRWWSCGRPLYPEFFSWIIWLTN